MVVVSACLLGRNCKYNGCSNLSEEVIELIKDKDVLAVCPETEAMLDVPREPSEIRGERVYSKSGEDLTSKFIKGAERCVSMLEGSEKDIEFAILKANSPSCGVGRVYDGTFTGTLTSGYGVFAQMLKEKGIMIMTEKEIEKWSI